MWVILCNMKVSTDVIGRFIIADGGVELVVRSTQLLLMIEDARDREVTASSKAMIIVS